MELIRRLALGSVLVFVAAGWLPYREEVNAGEASQHQAAAAIAEKVEKHIERTEKAEGKQDQVKDEVRVKTDAAGKPVVEEVGEASYYGKSFQGKKTAAGEKFDQRELTAAHPAFPLGTEAKVTNLENGKSVEVQVNDRGPYVKGRDLDLSKAAAQKLGIKKDGVAPVKIEAEVAPAGQEASANTSNDQPPGQQKK